MPQGSPILELHDITKAFGGVEAHVCLFLSPLDVVEPVVVLVDGGRVLLVDECLKGDDA